MRPSVFAILVVAVTTVYFVNPINATTLIRVTNETIYPGSTVVFTCYSSAFSVQMYAPPIIDETQRLSVFQDNSPRRCTGIRNAGIIGKLFDDGNTSTLLATLVLYIPRGITPGVYSVFCDSSTGIGTSADLTVNDNDANDEGGTNAQMTPILTTLTNETIYPGRTVVFNCIITGTWVVVYAPPIINETDQLNVTQANSFGYCAGKNNAGISGKLFDDGNTSTLWATLVLVVPPEITPGNYSVFCNGSDDNGTNATFVVDANDEDGTNNPENTMTTSTAVSMLSQLESLILALWLSLYFVL